MLSSSIVQTYRASLGDKYQSLKHQVIQTATRKNLVPSQTLFNFTEIDQDIQFPSPSTPGNLSHETASNSAQLMPQIPGRPPQPGLRTDIRIATPSVVFDPVELLPTTHSATGVTANIGNNVRYC